MRAITCSLFTRMSASTAASASPECPAEAIKPDTDPDLAFWLKLNADYAKSWPNITSKRDAPPDAKEFDGRPNKFAEYFSPEPGPGD